MPAQRVFLDGARAWLDAAAEELVARSTSAEYVDLQHLVVVLPGGRAGRHLLEHLQRRAEARSLPLVPPAITTVGNLPELLFERERPDAPSFVRDLAWLRALESAPPDDLRLIAPRPPADDDTLAWADLAATLAGLHAELTGEGLSFADVATRSADLPAFRDAPRWGALSRLQRRYLADLAALDRDDPYEARRAALAADVCRTARELVLLGVAEVNAVLRAMLDRVADRVTAIVLAPPSLAHRFDALGCLDVPQWSDAALDVPDELLDIVEVPTEQAAAVLHAMARFGGRYASEEVVVGVPDEEVVAPLAQQLALHGIESRSAAGLAVGRSAPFRLLAAIGDYLEHGRLSDLAALVRHPDLERHLRASFADDDSLRFGDWLTWLDRCASEHLMTRAASPWPPDERHPGALDRIHASVEALVGGLRGDPRPIRAWSAPMLAALTAVYGALPAAGGTPADRTTARCCLAIAQAVHDRSDLDPRADRVTTGFTALRMALRSVEGASVPAPSGEGAVEFLGWLELPLDDAPAMIVTGLNEGRVPAAPTVDPWLPEPLRRHLGLLDAERRYARDAYALSAIARGRQSVRYVAGRRSRASDPLAPSRLLLTGEVTSIARRVLAFYEGGTSLPPLIGALAAGRETSAMVLQRPSPAAARGTLKVNELKRYLDCPYTYDLERVLGLRGSDDGARELGPRAFGELARAVHAAFGERDGGRSTDDVAVAEPLDGLLRAEVARRYSEHPRPAVKVQVEVLRLRLAAFAAWQAQWAAQGWRIARVNAEAPEGAATFEVDGETIELRGRIDRVDVNELTGECVVFDYKTGDAVKNPEKAHRAKDAWVDFQLPLYRRIARALDLEGPVRVGYISLPRDVGEVGHHVAQWSDADLLDAEEAAREVVRAIMKQAFWPPKPRKGRAGFDDGLGALVRAAATTGDASEPP